MRQRTTAWLAWLLTLTAMGFCLGSLLFLAWIPTAQLDHHSPLWPVDPFVIAMLGYSVVGLVIALRRQTNPLGWMFVVIGLSYQLYAFANAYVVYQELVLPGTLDRSSLVLWLALQEWFVPFASMPALLLLFPSGHLLSRRWRPALWLVDACLAAGLVTLGTTVEAGGFSTDLPNLLVRLGMPNARDITAAVQPFIFFGTVASFVLGIISLAIRMRRSRAEERQQLKWFAFAGAFAVLVTFLEQILFETFPGLDANAFVPADLLFGIPASASFAFVPVAAGIAILKYHLYDIDVVIRRTLIYTILTALLAAVYFSSVVLLQETLRAVIGQTSDLAIVASTLAIAALFAPLRHRIQSVVDRRLYRNTYDAARVLASFGSAVRDEVDLSHLKEELLDVVHETVQPASASLWLKPLPREANR